MGSVGPRRAATNLSGWWPIVGQSGPCGSCRAAGCAIASPMTTFKAMDTARRNLSQRIDRYLAELEKRTTQPGRRGRPCTRVGPSRGGTFPDGERRHVGRWRAQPDAKCIHGKPQDLRVHGDAQVGWTTGG